MTEGYATEGEEAMALATQLTGETKVRMHDFDPDDDGGLKRGEADKRSEKLLAEMNELQELAYAAQQTPVLIVLQGMDGSGKDGTIRHVMTGMNPQSCRVASFKVPTPIEAAHDFLWRIHSETPARGTIAIFNRSHYEDVLVVRVHNLVPEQVWHERYNRINQFESLLADADTVILKFFLNISKDEQKKRLEEREKDPTKSWKLSPQDWKERELWDDYMAAYEDVLNRCSVPHAPWYVVPANHKWFRNLVIAETIVETLRPRRAAWLKQLEERGAEEMQLLRAQTRHHARPS